VLGQQPHHVCCRPQLPRLLLLLAFAGRHDGDHYWAELRILQGGKKEVKKKVLQEGSRKRGHASGVTQALHCN
jgi:hypothetical protein